MVALLALPAVVAGDERRTGLTGLAGVAGVTDPRYSVLRTVYPDLLTLPDEVTVLTGRPRGTGGTVRAHYPTP